MFATCKVCIQLNVYSATQYSSFEFVYGFNSITLLDLLPLLVPKLVNQDEKKMVEFVKNLHEKVRLNIETCTAQYMHQANKGRCKIMFEPGD